MLPINFKTIVLLFQDKKRKKDFQDGGHGGHLGFPIGTVLVNFFYLQVTPMLLPSFMSFGLSVQMKKLKIDFKDGGHLGFPIAIMFAIFDVQTNPMLPIKCQVNQPFGSGEEAKNTFSRRWPSWISHHNNFSYFLSTSHPDASYQVWCLLAFQFRERSQNRF